jgi:murein DD-endopeptidase MepM/ murein hydrolase activator NlpD
MRLGVWLLVSGVLAAAFGAASALADGTTTTSTGTTTTTAAPTYAPLSSAYLGARCVGAGAAAISVPGGKVLTLGTPASSSGPSAYPTDSPAVAFGYSAASGSGCTRTHVVLGSVSLFGGFVTASSVQSKHGKGTVSGLVIDGSPVSLGAGQSALVGFWGQLTLGKTVGRVTAPLSVLLLKRHWNLPAGTTISVAFAATPLPVSKSRTTHDTSTGSQATGTTADSGSQSQSQPGDSKKKHKHKHKKPVPQPLTVTPPLGFRPSHYVFPVDDGASYVDTYGANRNDVYDGWHHGDDLFARLGTPIVAVANGKLSLVGWNRLGGWRLWLTDGDGNSFYYAHLAGYSRWVLSHPNVRAGQVVGFLGRTGDAFTTPPHLHFEIHPQTLLSLGYDGAVDPTDYLKKWRTVRVPAKEMPQPAKLKAPVGTPEQEAAVVWRELLVARHLPLTAPTGLSVGGALPFPQPRAFEASGVSGPQIALLRRTAARVPASEDMSPWLGGGLGGGAVVLALSVGAFFNVRRRRRTAEETPSAAGEAAS